MGPLPRCGTAGACRAKGIHHEKNSYTGLERSRIKLGLDGRSSSKWRSHQYLNTDHMVVKESMSRGAPRDPWGPGKLIAATRKNERYGENGMRF
jgi:hypothetical protein